MLLEAIERVREVERDVQQRKALAQQQGQEMIRRAEQEGEALLRQLRAQLLQQRQTQEAELLEQLQEEETRLRAETEKCCADLTAQGRKHMVQAVRRIAEEVANGWPS